MHNYSIIKNFVKIRGILYFTFLFTIPILLVLIMDKVLLSKFITTNHVLLLTLKYLIFFIFYISFIYFTKYAFKFFSRENWFLSLGKALIPALIAYILGFIATLLIFLIIDFLPEITWLKDWIQTPNYGIYILLEYIKTKNFFIVIFLFFIIIVITPIYEEILFRGFLQDSISKIFKNTYLDIILVALIFSLFHIQSLSNALFAFIVGIFLSIYKKKEKSINITIWIHAIINFTGLLSAILSQYFI